MRKILVAVLSVLLVAALAGAGTFAYFSDEEVSSANTFTAGTLDLKLSNDGTSFTDGVTGTWVSPNNWAPGETVNGIVHCTNDGSIDSRHIYFTFDLTDDSNMARQIIVTDLRERFNGVTTANQAVNCAHQVGNHDDVLTLAELCGAQWYTYDDRSGDGVVLQAGDQKDYDLIVQFKFDENTGNEFQGDSCSFDVTLNATQNSPTDGYIALH